MYSNKFGTKRHQNQTSVLKRIFTVLYEMRHICLWDGRERECIHVWLRSTLVVYRSLLAQYCINCLWEFHQICIPRRSQTKIGYKLINIDRAEHVMRMQW